LSLAAARDPGLHSDLPRFGERRSGHGRRSGDRWAAKAPFLCSAPLLFLARHLFFSSVLSNKKNPPGPALGGWERSVAAVSL